MEWSGAVEWSVCFFGVFFLSRNVCHLRSDDYMKTT